MYVCMCHPFSDKTVREHLAAKDGTARVSEVYSTCTNGEKPRCCSCIETLKEIVAAHNKTTVAA
jgi:bacterioferritin-associated ferredoxin